MGEKKKMKLKIILVFLFLSLSNLFSIELKEIESIHKQMRQKYLDYFKSSFVDYCINNDDFKKYKNNDSIEYYFLPSIKLTDLDSNNISNNCKGLDIDTNFSNLIVIVANKNEPIGWFNGKNQNNQISFNMQFYHYNKQNIGLEKNAYVYSMIKSLFFELIDFLKKPCLYSFYNYRVVQINTDKLFVIDPINIKYFEAKSLSEIMTINHYGEEKWCDSYFETYFSGVDIKDKHDCNLFEIHSKYYNNFLSKYHYYRDSLKFEIDNILKDSICQIVLQDQINDINLKGNYNFNAKSITDRINKIQTNDIIFIPKFKIDDNFDQIESLIDYFSNNFYFEDFKFVFKIDSTLNLYYENWYDKGSFLISNKNKFKDHRYEIIENYFNYKILFNIPNFAIMQDKNDMFKIVWTGEYQRLFNYYKYKSYCLDDFAKSQFNKFVIRNYLKDK